MPTLAIIFLLTTFFATANGGCSAPAAQEERIEIAASYPRVQGTVTDTFTFQLELKYYGATARQFDLRITAPSSWTTFATPAYQEGTKISSITLQPITSTNTYGENIDIKANVTSYPLPEPGQYKIALEVVSGSVRNSIDLTAEIIASYGMTAAPVSGLYNTKVTAGGSVVYSVEITNTGTAPITNIQFTSDKAQGWQVGVGPVGKIDSLDGGTQQTINLTIIPAPKTIVGDYYITFWVSGTQATQSVLIRVTVEAPMS